MSEFDHPPTVAEMLVRRLRQHGVTHVFGYPGGQLTPIYDALYHEPAIRQVLARDEQAAGFMADGYARATGKPGVCLAVCGPGVYNAATPLATAFTDSVPILVISGQVASRGRGLRSGYYHENEQLIVCETLTKYLGVAREQADLVEEIDNCLQLMSMTRPGPALLEIPVDVLRQEYSHTELPPMPTPLAPFGFPPWEEIQALASLIGTWKKPLLMGGGGVISAGAEALLARLADHLGAPVFTTFMGKCALSSEHPLKVGLPWRQVTSDLTNMESFMSPLFAEADGLLAIGCRFTQAATGSWALKPPRSLAQIDIDGSEIGRHYPVEVGVGADAALALERLLAVLPTEPRVPWATPVAPRDPWRLSGWDLVGPLRRAVPRDGIVVADVTRLAYVLLAEFPVYQPRTFLHPAGFVSMGYGIPAALGVKAAFPERAVVAVVGDGGFLMSGMELATAVQEQLPVVIVLINDRCLTLIKSIQQRRYGERYIGVDLANPDFEVFARAFGVDYWRPESDAAFETALGQALQSGKAGLIEVQIA